MFKFKRRQERQVGLPPGTPVHMGEKRLDEVRITVIDYNESRVEERTVPDVDACFPYRDTATVTWINVDGVHDVGVVERLGACFGIHPIVLEDIVNTELRPKMIEFGEHVFVILKMIFYTPEDEVEIEQVSLIFGKNFVISFQEDIGDVFEPVRAAIRSGKGRIRKAGADYLACALMDSVVDGYFLVFERLGEEIEEAQAILVASPDTENLRDIHHLKEELIALRKSIWPLREVVVNLERADSPLISKSTAPFFRNVYDHTIEVMDTVESFRDLVSGMLDIYLSSVSMKLNEIMKVLTIIATIFIPLTFVVGLYGMNFRYMPELSWRFGYPAVLLVMLAAAGGMLVYFRKRKWL